MISLFVDTFYIVRILDYQAEGVRRGGQKGGRGEKGEGGWRKGREERKGEGEVGGRRKGERGERGGGRTGRERGREKGEGEERKVEMGERDPLYPLIYDHPFGASRLQIEVQKTKTNCDHFSSVLFLQNSPSEIHFFKKNTANFLLPISDQTWSQIITADLLNPSTQF